MNADPSAKPSPVSGGRTGRIECRLDHDSRLLASLAVVMAYAARRAGLPEQAQEDFAAAAAQASREMVGQAGPATTCLVLEEFSDRLELTIDSPAGSKSGAICKNLQSKMNDRIHCELQDGRVRLTLLKPCGAAKSGSAS